jgi:hypothetical protein
VGTAIGEAKGQLPVLGLVSMPAKTQGKSRMRLSAGASVKKGPAWTKSVESGNLSIDRAAIRWISVRNFPGADEYPCCSLALDCASICALEAKKLDQVERVA